MLTLAASQAEFQDLEVEYISLPGWKSSTEAARTFAELPTNAQNYVRKVEELIEVPGEILASWKRGFLFGCKTTGETE